MRYLEDWLARPIGLISLVLFFCVGTTCVVVGAAARVVLRLGSRRDDP